MDLENPQTGSLLYGLGGLLDRRFLPNNNRSSIVENNILSHSCLIMKKEGEEGKRDQKLCFLCVCFNSFN